VAKISAVVTYLAAWRRIRLCNIIGWQAVQRKKASWQRMKKRRLALAAGSGKRTLAAKAMACSGGYRQWRNGVSVSQPQRPCGIKLAWLLGGHQRSSK
jgi:hypothetical protein